MVPAFKRAIEIHYILVTYLNRIIFVRSCIHNLNQIGLWYLSVFNDFHMKIISWFWYKNTAFIVNILCNWTKSGKIALLMISELFYMLSLKNTYELYCIYSE